MVNASSVSATSKKAVDGTRSSLFRGVSKLIKQFEAEDFARKNAINSTVLARRRDLATSFFAFLSSRKAIIGKTSEINDLGRRVALSSDDYETVMTIEETILEVKEEVIAN